MPIRSGLQAAAFRDITSLSKLSPTTYPRAPTTLASLRPPGTPLSSEATNSAVLVTYSSCIYYNQSLLFIMSSRQITIIPFPTKILLLSNLVRRLVIEISDLTLISLVRCWDKFSTCFQSDCYVTYDLFLRTIKYSLSSQLEGYMYGCKERQCRMRIYFRAAAVAIPGVGYGTMRALALRQISQHASTPHEFVCVPVCE